MSRREVRRTYDQIADHFARTRPRPWSEVVDFVDGRSGRLGVDVGVGNGRHAELLAAACEAVVGLDLSRASIAAAEARADERAFDLSLLLGDAATLPIRSNCVDLAVYVATLHHLGSRELRVGSLTELARVLRPSGRAIVSAWSVGHGRFEEDAGFDTTVDWTLPDGEVVERFYHIYDGEEFRRDVDAGGLGRVETFESHGNWYAVVGPEQ